MLQNTSERLSLTRSIKEPHLLQKAVLNHCYCFRKQPSIRLRLQGGMSSIQPQTAPCTPQLQSSCSVHSLGSSTAILALPFLLLLILHSLPVLLESRRSRTHEKESCVCVCVCLNKYLIFKCFKTLSIIRLLSASFHVK